MDQDVVKLEQEDRAQDANSAVVIDKRSSRSPHSLRTQSPISAQPQLAPPRLTQREREVLRWTAEGKTAFEISIIVGLTERTVNFHIRRVLAKFEATNKTQAAVKAAVMGLLS